MDPDPRAFWLKFETVNREDWTGQKLDVTTWEDEISFIQWTVTAHRPGSPCTLIGVLLVIIVVGIMNTLWIAIRERTREIGTLRAIGMQRGPGAGHVHDRGLHPRRSPRTLAGAALGLGVCALLNAGAPARAAGASSSS